LFELNLPNFNNNQVILFFFVSSKDIFQHELIKLKPCLARHETNLKAARNQLDKETLDRKELEATNQAIKSQLEHHAGTERNLLNEMNRLFGEQQRIQGEVNQLADIEMIGRMQLERENGKMKKDLERQVRMDRDLLNKMDELFDEQQRLRALVNKMDVKERQARADLEETSRALSKKTNELESLRADLKSRKIIF
jgi:hypothetical protein